MPELTRRIELSHRAADVYAVVANVQRYAEFLPWLERVEIIDQRPQRVDAVLHAARVGMHPHYRTLFELEPTEAVRMQLIEGPMQRLDGRWQFAETAAEKTLVTLAVDYEFANPLVALLFGTTFRHAIEDLVGRVGDRADALYG